eukprot:CAMPEP_0195246310 /NCGR_PEP_ID=MMETSP0706-20130129/324_1 /TAXON_ID=33640 /ORGANISM="Asterionellopsis glacialis, Strain CCMP134" /LENGTH=185 /DNA_ID=CAMNT_0040297657 /DNA_START=7 /DNA_END=564 /DNA_ORIENTATION=+
MASFNVSWKKLTTFCAVMMGCAVLLVNRQKFGASIRGGVASSLPSLAGVDPNRLCYISYSLIGTNGMKDSGLSAEVKVHVMVNGRYTTRDFNTYYFNIRGSLPERTTNLGGSYQHKPIKNSDKISVTFEEVDDFSSNDWAETATHTNLCENLNGLSSWYKYSWGRWTALWDKAGDVYVEVNIERP